MPTIEKHKHTRRCEAVCTIGQEADVPTPETCRDCWGAPAGCPTCWPTPGASEAGERRKELVGRHSGKVACEYDDGTVKIHSEDTTCELCAPPAPSPKPGETEALLEEAEQVLLQVEGSAFPSERDNPAMWRAWARMNAFLAKLAARRSRG